MAHALEEAWAVLKYDDDFDNDEDWDIMDMDERCSCQNVPYTRCQCPVSCDGCDCNLLQEASRHVETEGPPSAEDNERKRALEELGQERGDYPTHLPESELPTLGRESEEESLRGWAEEELQESPVKHKRDYSHMDPNQAAWHQEMDRRARGTPEAYKNYLAGVYQSWKNALEEGNAQIMRDAEEVMAPQGGRLRVGEMLGDEEAIEELKQYDLGAADRSMGILSAEDFGQVGVVEDNDAPDGDPDEEPKTRKELSQIDRLLDDGPRFTESRRERERGLEHGEKATYVRTNTRERSGRVKGKQSGGEDRLRGKQYGRTLGDHKKESTMQRAKPHHIAYLTASKLAARLHANRANREGGWAYQKPEGHPDFAAELPPPRSVLVQRPSGERTALPAGTYEKPHPELVGDEEE